MERIQTENVSQAIRDAVYLLDVMRDGTEPLNAISGNAKAPATAQESPKREWNVPAVGDKVKVLADSCSVGFTVGSIVEISSYGSWPMSDGRSVCAVYAGNASGLLGYIILNDVEAVD